MKLLAEVGFDRIAVVLEIGVDMFAALASRDRRRNDMVVRKRMSESRSFSNSKGQQFNTNRPAQKRKHLNPRFGGNCIDQALSGYKVEVNREEKMEFGCM
jgi:hypothetical protein